MVEKGSRRDGGGLVDGMKPRLRRWRSVCSTPRDEVKREIRARAHIHAWRSRGWITGGGKGKAGMIARSDYVFTRSGGRNGRENSLGSAVPRTAVRLFELCMDTGCLQRVLFALPRSTTILEASPRARMTWKHTTARPTVAVPNSNLNSATLARRISRESRLSPTVSADVLRANFATLLKSVSWCTFIFNRI